MHMHLSYNEITFSNHIATDNNLLRVKGWSKILFQHEEDEWKVVHSWYIENYIHYEWSKAVFSSVKLQCLSEYISYIINVRPNIPIFSC